MLEISHGMFKQTLSLLDGYLHGGVSSSDFSNDDKRALGKEMIFPFTRECSAQLYVITQAFTNYLKFCEKSRK